MRVFLAGATGVIGSRLIPLLVESGHDVAGLTRTPAKAALVANLGARPAVGDVFDRERIIELVTAFKPDVMMHQLTDLPDDVRHIHEFTAANARIRREGTANLLESARRNGITRFFAQSVAWELEGDGGAAVAEMESGVLEFGGTVLRYGQFYGAGTYHPDTPPQPPRVHIDNAAQRTVAALAAEPGTLEIVDPANDE